MPTSDVRRRVAPAIGALALLLATGGCAGSLDEPQRSAPSATPRDSASAPSSAPASSAEPTASSTPAERGPPTSDGRPRRAQLTIPRIGLRDLAVVPYRGWTDDAPGTRIQDRGLAASPHGPRGGVGPGGIGNYQVTAHRLSSTQAFLDLPDLRKGDRVRVRAGGTMYVYEIVETRETSFRSAESLRAQRAAVPGRPGQEPTRAMITLSTCATPEDRAAGNHWSDEFGNPEHRIDKIGVLVATRRA